MKFHTKFHFYEFDDPILYEISYKSRQMEKIHRNLYEKSYKIPAYPTGIKRKQSFDRNWPTVPLLKGKATHKDLTTA